MKIPNVTSVVAAIDCGTNAIRLLIAEVTPEGGVRDLHREMRTVRLGEGVDQSREFSPAALERTFAACAEYQKLIVQSRAVKLRFIATSASRDARNKEVFFHGVEQILGVMPEVIDGAEEASLSYVGATSGFEPTPDQPILVADIGGGSTEFVMASPGGALLSSSVNMGCVRMTERHLRSDPPTSIEIDATISDIHRFLTDVQRVIPVSEARTFIGLAGSVTTIAAMSLGLDSYDPSRIHGTVLSLAQVEDVTEWLLTMTRSERSDLPFMHPGRVDVIGGGALVLRESMRELRLERVLVSEHDLLDGAVINLA